MISQFDLWRTWRRMCASLACAGIVKVEAMIVPWEGAYAHLVRGWTAGSLYRGIEPKEFHWTRPVTFLPGVNKDYDRYIAHYVGEAIEHFHEMRP